MMSEDYCPGIESGGECECDDADVFGCVTIPVRPMSGRERNAWNLALYAARKRTADVADDVLCGKANDAEEASVSAEHKGKHEQAVELWRVSELYDVARKALI